MRRPRSEELRQKIIDPSKFLQSSKEKCKYLTESVKSATKYTQE